MMNIIVWLVGVRMNIIDIRIYENWLNVAWMLDVDTFIPGFRKLWVSWPDYEIF